MTTYTPADAAQRPSYLPQLLGVAGAVLSLGALIRESWQERPARRVAALAGVAFYWSAAWLGAALLLLLIPDLRGLFPLLVLAATGLFAAVVFVAAGARQTAHRLSLAALGLPGLWLLVVAPPLFISDGLFLIRYPLVYLLSGWLLIWALWVIALFLPLWGVHVRAGEVYLVRQPTMTDPQGFTLYTRPAPVIPPDLTAALHQAGIPPDMLRGFLHFNGPQQFRRMLGDRIQPGMGHLLSELYQRVDQQAGVAAPLWMSALDHVRLYWNTFDTVAVDTTVREVVTSGGHPVDLRLRFAVVFDPTLITDAEFYMSLPRRRSCQQVREMLEALLSRAAEAVVRQTFIGITWEAALAEASVERFRQDFPDRMAWTLNLGISLNPYSVQCNPVFTQRILDAEEAMRASRAEARTQTARLNALVDRVMHEDVPRELLAAMMFFDQGQRLTLNWPGSEPLMPGGAHAFPWEASADTVSAASVQQPDVPLIQSTARTIADIPAAEHTRPHQPPVSASPLSDDWTQSGSDYTLQALIERRRNQSRGGPRTPDDSGG